MPLTPLRNQAMLEDLLRPRGKPADSINSNKAYAAIVVIAFGASWCGPCKRIDKELISKKVPDAIMCYCDVDENEDSLQYCGLSKIPSFSLIKNGVFIGNLEGAKNESAVLEWLSNNGVPVAKFD